MGSQRPRGRSNAPDWEGGPVGCIDFTNPDAVEVYQRWLGKLFDLGARTIKVDFGEQAPVDGVYHDGTPGHRMRNRYPLLYNRAVAEATHARTGEWIIWARAAFAGSQRYPLHWGGDSSARWDNLFANVAGGLSGEDHQGPTWLTTHSPIEHFPLYQRAASLIPLAPVMAHVRARPTDVLTLRAGAPTATSESRGVARVDGEAVTITATRRDPTVVVDGLSPSVDVRIVDGSGDPVDRPIRRI